MGSGSTCLNNDSRLLDPPSAAGSSSTGRSDVSVTQIGFHASHEQIGPRGLLDAVVHAERAGFDAAMCSDHLAPWSVRQGQSGHAWSWLGAALQATEFPIGVVTAPGQRYHPVITAQSIATLAELFPGRFWAALGSGEAVNEHVTGDPWPPKPVRDRRLEESAAIVRDLLAGREVSHAGLVTVDRARIWSLPDVHPPLLAAAASPATAARVATWADGMITFNQPAADLREIIDAFRSVAGSKPVYVQVHVSWDPDPERAMRIATDQWRFSTLPQTRLWDIDSPEEFDRETRVADDVAIASSVIISSSLSHHVAAINEICALGVDGVYLHHVGTDQRRFIDVFGEHVVPHLRPPR